MASHLISISVADGEDASYIKSDILPYTSGIRLIGFAVDPNPGAFYTAYLTADTYGAAVNLADQLGVGVDDIVMADLEANI